MIVNVVFGAIALVMLAIAVCTVILVKEEKRFEEMREKEGRNNVKSFQEAREKKNEIRMSNDNDNFNNSIDILHEYANKK